MDHDWLEGELASGRSIESLAREVGKSPSTVAYWVHKHSLESTRAAKHAARGGVERAALAELVEQGLTVRQIAAELSVGYATVQHWLRRYELKTLRGRRPRAPEAQDIERRCAHHGLTVFTRYSDVDHYRCLACRKARVVARRRQVKALLVLEAGGSCVLCGYDRYSGALHFHHIDPATKAFGLGVRGVARALDRCREEARKCALLCANCHAEVEAGVARLPSAETEASFGVVQAGDHIPG